MPHEFLSPFKHIDDEYHKEYRLLSNVINASTVSLFAVVEVDFVLAVQLVSHRKYSNAYFSYSQTMYTPWLPCSIHVHDIFTKLYSTVFMITGSVACLEQNPLVVWNSSYCTRGNNSFPCFTESLLVAWFENWSRLPISVVRPASCCTGNHCLNLSLTPEISSARNHNLASRTVFSQVFQALETVTWSPQAQFVQR